MRASTDRRTVLIVDGSSRARTVLKGILEKEYDILEAADESAALAELEQHPSDLAVLDVALGGISSSALLRVVRENPSFRNLPVIVLTDEYLSHERQALESGAADVVCKPYSATTLLHRVHSVLSHRETQRLLDESRVLKAQLARKEESLALAEIDEKAGLLNKQTFFRRALELIRSNPDVHFAILMFDIDNFKLYNDIFGTAAGDRFIADVGNLFSRAARSERLIAHIEGDRFAACLPLEDIDLEQMSKQAAEWLGSYNSSFEFMPRLGLYKIDKADADVSLMCDRALLALRSTKGSYDRRFALYDESMRSRLLEEQALISEMNSALASGQFCFYLQPQYNTVTGALIGAEALVRWLHPEKGLISPVEFIPIFEKSGFITQLDMYVWESVCRTLRQWLDAGSEIVPISVNLSRVDVYNPHLCEILEGLLREYDLDSSMMHLEITETAYMENPTQLINMTQKLRDAGFFVEMDDFGSGYSSLNTLKDVPVDLLKLDLKFISDEDTAGRGGVILNSVVRMARWLGLPVIAEGVETSRQADYLKTIGCSRVQGFLYSKPLTVREFEPLLAKLLCETLTEATFTASFFNSSEFWSPDAQATVIFNSFVGAAGLFELHDGRAEALRVNDKFFDVVGVDRSRYFNIKNRVMDSIHPDDRAAFLSMLERARMTGIEGKAECRWLHPSREDKLLWLSVRVQLIAHSPDRSVFYIAIEDISKNKLLEQRNRSLSEHLSAIIDSVPGGIVTYEFRDPSSAALSYFNDNTCSMFGFTRKEFTKRFGSNALCAVHPNDLPELSTLIERSLKIGVNAAISASFRHLHKDGGYRWTLISGRVTARRDGVYCASGVMTDIHSIRLAQDEDSRRTLELERQRVFLQTLYDTIPCGVIVYSYADGAPVFIGCNSTALTVLGYDNADEYNDVVRECGTLSVIHESDRVLARETIARAKDSDEKISVSLRICRPDGQTTPVRSTLQRAVTPDGLELIECIIVPVAAPVIE